MYIFKLKSSVEVITSNFLSYVVYGNLFLLYVNLTIPTYLLYLIIAIVYMIPLSDIKSVMLLDTWGRTRTTLG